MRPVKVQGPFVAATGDDGCDACCLELLDGTQEVVPGLDGGAVNAGLGEKVFVVEKTDLRRLERHPDNFSVERETLDGGWDEALFPLRIHGRGDIFNHPRLDLLAHDAAAPAVNDVGPLGRLQQRGQLGLVGLVFHVLHVNFHTGLGGFKTLGHIGVKRLNIRVLIHVHHAHRDLRQRRAD